MIRKFKATTLALSLACIGLGSTAVLANGHDDDDDDDDYVINASMTVRGDEQPSGSGDTILANCGPSSGKQTATVKVEQEGGTSKVKFKIRDARPDTVYTVWLRIQGGADWNRNVNGNQGSPLTGGGATPLAPGSALDALNDYSPWGIHPAGSANPTNGFTTDEKGNANWTTHVDFPIIGGAYPFQAATTANRPGWEGVPNVAHAIPTPDSSPGTPFLFRVISHCTDGVGHGLAPGTREAWFQYP